MNSTFYETQRIANQYLLFHYGLNEEVMPFSFGPKNSLQFPVRCVTECIDFKALPSSPKAMELGCAVGRSSFELSKHCETVLAVDNSQLFISLAKRLQDGETIEFALQEEGAAISRHIAVRPPTALPDRIEFKCCDVMELSFENDSFDLVLAANLLCRLPDPLAFLQKLPRWVAPKGQLILISPYSWLEKYTPKKNWPQKGSMEFIYHALQSHFTLQRSFDLPFIIREHKRKYQWGVSEATIWIKK